MYSEKIIDTFPEELVAHLKGFVMKKVRVTDWDNPNTCIRYRLIGNGIIHIYELYAVCSEGKRKVAKYGGMVNEKIPVGVFQSMIDARSHASNLSKEFRRRFPKRHLKRVGIVL